MKLAKLASNNLRRTPTRSVLTAVSVLIATATLTVVLSVDRGYSKAVERDLVEKTGVHLYITKEGCPIEAAAVIAQGGLSPLYVEENLVDKVRAIPEVAAVLPFQLFTATTKDGSRTDIFMGITEEIRAIRPDWIITNGGWFSAENSVILGSQIAQIENVAPGDKLYSEKYDKEFVVAGILAQNWGQDDGTIFLPLKTAQKMIERSGKLSAIAIKLKDISRLQDVTLRLRGDLPKEYYVLGSKELSDGILGFFSATRMIMFVMVIVAFGVSVFGILNTMLMAVMERRREMAYLKCVGAKKRDILGLVTLESLILCSAGAIAGAGIGLALMPAADHLLRGLLIAYIPAGSITDPTLPLISLSILLTVAVGVLCALYPAWKAASIVPMEVLRNE